jgi:hypothetical protein
MAETIKVFSEYDMPQIIQKTYNAAGALCTEGWITGQVRRRITPTIVQTNVAGDTERYTYSEWNGTQYVVLMVLDTVYTDGTRVTVLYNERVQ